LDPIRLKAAVLLGAPERVAAILRTRRIEQRFHALGLGGFQQGEVLIRAGAEGGVIEAHAVHEIQDVIPGQPARKR